MDLGTTTVANFSIESGYTQTITIGLPLIGLGSVTVSGTFTFAGGTGAKILGTQSGGQNPTFTVNGTFEWEDGSYEKTNIVVGANSANSTISTTGTKVLSTGKLTNNGTLTWAAGDVSTVGASVEVINNGTFKMESSGSLGTAGAGKFTNGAAGTLRKLTSSDSTVKIDFDNRGNFYVENGKAIFDGGFDQGHIGVMGVGPHLTRLNGGNLDVTLGLTMYQGTLEGFNTITGSVFNYGGITRGGLAASQGTLTITGNYYQTDGIGNSGSMAVYITAAGQSSVVSVGGNASLGGTVSVNNSAYTGTSNMTFLAVTGTTSGNFASLYLTTSTWQNGGSTYTFVLSGDNKTLNCIGVP